MGNELLEIKWDEALQEMGESLSREKAREILTGAIGFIFAVDRQRKDQYLAAETKERYGKTLSGLVEITKKYPDVKGALAQIFLQEVEKEEKEEKLTSIRILHLCDRAVRIGICREWIYLGKEKKTWRRANEEEGEIWIRHDVREAAVHVYDFRSGQQRMRHFFPTDWPRKEQGQGDEPPRLIDNEMSRLTKHLGAEVKRNEEAYRAAHPRPDRPKAVTEVKPTESPSLVEPVAQVEVPVAEPPPETTKPKQKRTRTKKASASQETEDGKPPKSRKAKETKGGRAAEKRAVLQAAETGEEKS